MSDAHVELGLGLIGIGKPWGVVPNLVPSESDARQLLETAVDLGIRYFDTAPSYGDGVSEARLGQFLRSLPPALRASLTVATKAGEHWNPSTGEPFADHSFDALRRSIDASIHRLGDIDILQLHKTTPQALESGQVHRAWEYARAAGIACLGASVSDLASAHLALHDPGCEILQFPLNRDNRTFAPLLDNPAARSKRIAINRPFAMGAVVHQGGAAADAFRFILGHRFTGVILTGTTSQAHLRENWQAFRQAVGG